MQVRWPWHLGMITWTPVDAPVQKINKIKCRYVTHIIQECSSGHGGMHLVGKKLINAGPSAIAFGNAHLDTDGCTCLENVEI